MFIFRLNPKAVSSYSDQAFKARLRERFASLIATLFYYRPVEGEERQLDKKKLLYIGISSLAIAFVTSYVPYVGDWFSNTIQPTLSFQQDAMLQPLEVRPVLAPELSLQELPKAVEGISSPEDAVLDGALKPEPEGDLVTSLDEQEEAPLNILDYLFKPEDIKVEEVAVPAPVPAPVDIEEVKIDPFPIEAMPPEIRAQLGNSPPLEGLVGGPIPYSGPNLDLDSSYQGKTGVFRESSGTPNSLSVYTDSSRIGSSLQLEGTTKQSQSFSEPLNNQAASFHETASLAPKSSMFRESITASSSGQIFQSELGRSALSIFQSSESATAQSTVFQSSPSQAANYQAPHSEAKSIVQYQANASETGNLVQYQSVPEAVFTESYRDENTGNSRPSYQVEQKLQDTVVFNSSPHVGSNATLVSDTDQSHAGSYQAETLSVADEAINVIHVYSDTATTADTIQIGTASQSEAIESSFRQQPSISNATTVFTQPALVGGSTFRRIPSELSSTEATATTEATSFTDEFEEIQETDITSQTQDTKEHIDNKLELEDYITTSDLVDASLVTGTILLPNSTQPVVAKANSNWCSKVLCPDLVFIGTATYKSGNRAELSFDQVVFDGAIQQTSSFAIDTDNAVGLPVNLSDTTPTLAQDLVRGALSGVASYANALANQTTITSSAVGTIEQSSVPAIENFVLGNLAKLFSTQAEQTAVVRIAELKAGTAFTIVYDISERNSYERFATPYRFSN